MTGREISKLLLAALVWITVSACAATSGPMKPGSSLEQDMRQIESMSQESKSAQERLLQELGLSAEPECQEAKKLLENICELSRRICVIAKRHTDDQKMKKLCEQSTQSCEKSRVKVSIRCQ